MTISEVCDWYLSEAHAGRLLGRRRLPITKSTLMEASRIERHIKPLIGSRRDDSLRTPHIEAFQSSIAAGKTSRPKAVGRGRATVGGAGAARDRYPRYIPFWSMPFAWGKLRPTRRAVCAAWLPTNELDGSTARSSLPLASPCGEPPIKANIPSG